jgi:histidinol-phosphate aminotransferase
MLTLHRNENIFGLSPSVRFILQSSCAGVYQYPGDELRLLQRVLAREFGVEESCVTLGAGSTEVLRFVLSAWLQLPGVRLFCADPTYPPVLAIAGSPDRVVRVPSRLARHLDLVALRAEVDRHVGPAVVYLSHPDCHSGELLSRPALANWIAEAGARVRFIVDEAYMEFVPDANEATVLPCLADFADRLLVLRTFSKAYGLAGLRIGYGLSGRPLPGGGVLAAGLGTLAVRAAIEAFDDRGWLEHARCLLTAARTHLQQGLSAQGLDWLPGHGNFVLHTLPAGSKDFVRALRPYGVRVAYPLPGLPQWCRATVGTIPDMNYYLSVLSTLAGDD